MNLIICQVMWRRYTAVIAHIVLIIYADTLSYNILQWTSFVDWAEILYFFSRKCVKKDYLLILLNLWVLSSCVAIIGRFAETEIPLNFKNLRKKSRKFPFPFIHLYYTNQLLQWWNKFVYEYDLQSCHFRWK